MPLRVPPKSEATCFIQPNGASKRHRPAGGHVRVGLGAAPLVDELQHVLDLLLHAVEVGVLVEHAVLAALAAGAVVADDVEDQRVVDLPDLLERLEHAGRSRGRCTRRTPAKTSAWRAKRRFSSAESLSQSLIAGGFGASFVPGGHDARRDLPGERLLADLVPALVELALPACRSTPWARGAARGSRRARSTRRTACPGVMAFWYLIQATRLVRHVRHEVVVRVVRQLDLRDAVVEVAAPTGSSRRRGSRRTCRSPGASASGRTGRRRWSPRRPSRATCRRRRCCSRSAGASRRAARPRWGSGRWRPGSRSPSR